MMNPIVATFDHYLVDGYNHDKNVRVYGYTLVVNWLCLLCVVHSQDISANYTHSFSVLEWWSSLDASLTGEFSILPLCFKVSKRNVSHWGLREGKILYIRCIRGWPWKTNPSHCKFQTLFKINLIIHFWANLSKAFFQTYCLVLLNVLVSGMKVMYGSNFS